MVAAYRDERAAGHRVGEGSQLTWMDVIGWAGVYIVSAGGLGWLAKALVTYWIDKDVARFKGALEDASAREIERLRAELRLAELEFYARAVPLQTMRIGAIEAIREGYDRHFDAAEALAGVDEHSAPGVLEERFDEFMDASMAFRRILRSKRLYLSAELCERLDRYAAKLSVTGMSYAREVKRAEGVQSADPQGSLEKKWEKLATVAIENGPSVRSAMDDEFRALLGVLTDPPARGNQGATN